MESPISAARLMTPTVRDRGGIICVNPPRGGFFIAGARLRRQRAGRSAISSRSNLAVGSPANVRSRALTIVLDLLGCKARMDEDFMAAA